MNMMQVERAARMNAMWRESAWIRIRSQIQFAEHMATVDGKRGAAWHKRIEHAQAATAAALAGYRKERAEPCRSPFPPAGSAVGW